MIILCDSKEVTMSWKNLTIKVHSHDGMMFPPLLFLEDHLKGKAQCKPCILLITHKLSTCKSFKNRI